MKKTADNRALGNPGTPAFQLEKYPFYLLNRAVSRYNIIIGSRLRSIGIDIPTWRVLMILGEKTPCSIGQIAESAVINLSTMMRIVQRMEGMGLVEYGVNETDARVTHVHLAKAGAKKLTEARAKTAPVYAELIAGFASSEFDELLDLLNRLQGNLDRILRTTC